MAKDLVLDVTTFKEAEGFPHEGLDVQYQKSIDALYGDLNAALTLYQLTTEAVPTYLSYDIAPLPERWRKERRLFQTKIIITGNPTAPFAGKAFEDYLSQISQQINNSKLLGPTAKKQLLEQVAYFAGIHAELLDDYRRKFLRATQDKLRQKIATQLSGSNQTSLSAKIAALTLPENEMETRHQTRLMHWTVRDVAAQITQANPQDKTLEQDLNAFATVSNLIIDDYYFDPIRSSLLDKTRGTARVVAMSSAVIINLLLLIFIIVLIFIPPAAPAVPVLTALMYYFGFVGLIGLWPVVDDLFDLAMCAIYKRMPTCENLFLNVAFPFIMICAIVPTMVILLAPVAVGVKLGVTKLFELIGGYVIPSIATVANSWFSKISISGLWKRATTIKSWTRAHTQPDVELQDGLKLFNQDRSLNERVALHTIKKHADITATTMSVDESALPALTSTGKTPSSLCLFYGDTKRGWHILPSKQAEIIKSSRTTWWGNPVQKSKEYTALQTAITAYSQCAANAPINERVAKVTAIITRCTEWYASHLGDNTSRRKPNVDAAIEKARGELRHLRVIQGQSPGGATPETAQLKVQDQNDAAPAVILMKSKPRR